MAECEGSPRWVHEKEVARILGIPRPTLARWRHESRKRQKLIGPPFIVFSHRMVRYRLSAVMQWAEKFERDVLRRPLPTVQRRTEEQRVKIGLAQREWRARRREGRAHATGLDGRPN